jgi:predicted nuclease of predicted toxin-antitoxin system
MTYFIDENLPPRLLEGLEVNGRAVPFVALRSLYPANTKDPDWIPDAGANGWVVLSRDAKMAQFRVHRAALEQHKVMIVFLPKSLFNKKAMEQKVWVSLNFSKIHAFVSALSQPSAVRVAANGTCAVLWP